jgi:hypothetical protein
MALVPTISNGLASVVGLPLAQAAIVEKAAKANDNFTSPSVWQPLSTQ